MAVPKKKPSKSKSRSRRENSIVASPLDLGIFKDIERGNRDVMVNDSP